jgi:hypothetical protein
MLAGGAGLSARSRNRFAHAFASALRVDDIDHGALEQSAFEAGRGMLGAWLGPRGISAMLEASSGELERSGLPTDSELARAREQCRLLVFVPAFEQAPAIKTTEKLIAEQGIEGEVRTVDPCWLILAALGVIRNPAKLMPPVGQEGVEGPPTGKVLSRRRIR